MTGRRLIIAGLLALASAADVGPAIAATRYDPRLHFRVLRTPHFAIYFHQGEEADARRLAIVAEEVRTALEPQLGIVAARVHVILVDQSDLSNGWATPIPWDAIEIDARPPALGSSIGNTTDWLRLVFTHEYTHILHLDRSRGLFGGIRRVFGRVPLAFPNTFLPQWQVEGIATFEESRQTGEGRVHSGDFGVIVDEAARTGRFEPRDRVAGGLDDWPSGDGAYAYGSYFQEYLAERFGADRIAALRDATSGRIPYFGSGAFEHVFGEPLGQLWNDFAAARAGHPSSSKTDAAATRMTRHGFDVGALTVNGALFYSVANPHGYPSLMTLSPGGEPVRLAWRFAGDRTTARGQWIVFDQAAPVRSVAWYSDLYAVKAAGDGRVHRLTRETRAAEPALSPDGTRIACVVERAGHRALAELPFRPDRVETPRIIVDEADADFGGPQWSPDGTRLVAERRRAGAFEIVEVDAGSHVVRTLLSSHVRLATPVWIDDARILFAAQLPGSPSNAFTLDIRTRQTRRVTDSLTGVRFPHLSADGRTLFYIGYTPDGSDLFSVSVDEADWQSADLSASDGATVAPPPSSGEGTRVIDDHAYSPWPTLRPSYWTPEIYTDAGELNFGAGTAMSDVLGRHSYGAQAAWSSRARPDWSVSYAYDRWRPTVFASYSDDTDPVRGGEIRSRQFQAGAALPFLHLRRTETLFAAIDLERDELTCDGPCRTRATSNRRAAVQAAWSHDTRRLFGYSVSAEEGHLLSGSFESTLSGLGSDVAARALIVDARAYRRVGTRHTVFAIRGAAAAAWGALDDRHVFAAAGSGPAGGPFSFDRNAIGLLRGFAPDDVVATRAAVANADLRFPIVRAERGAGALPLFVRSMHGAVFLDAGTASDGAVHARNIRTSAGGEVSLDVVLGHYLPLTLAGGAAWTRDPVSSRSGSAVFGRIGRAF